MEDILYYIGLGAIVIFSLSRKIGRTAAQKRRRRGEHTHQNVPIPTGFPQFEPLSEEIIIRHKQLNTTPLDIQEETQSLETIIDEEHLYTKNFAQNTTKKGAPRKGSRTAGKQSHKSSKPEANKSPQNRDNSPVSEEFDIQKAVIYSEILKPKFEE